jgi:acetolactate synthase-1/2/3 large subunit
VTSGCGATNAVTPCLIAYQDGVPVFFISGQVQKDDNVHVEIEVPGFAVGDLNISVTGDVLKVTGKAQEKTEEKKDRKYFMTEISERSFTHLPTANWC